MDTLPQELYREIFKFMRPIDLMVSVQYTDSLRNHITKQELLHKFQNWSQLSVFFTNPKSFLNLFTNNCLLSGSIMVQFLLNEIYNGDSDIDIYLTRSETNKCQSFLQSEKYTLVKKSLQYTDHTFNRIEKDYFYVETYCNAYNKKNVQLIVTNDPHQVINDFDFNIVKNYYDGQSICFNENLQNKTEIMSNVQRSKLSFMQTKRLVKYTDRGFEFLIEDDTPPFKKMKKYNLQQKESNK